MPFTFSHPAIVLPLALFPRRYISVTGIVIGSLAPDFEYFLRMKVQSNYSHTLAGLFWFNLPLGLLLAFTFYVIVRNCLFKNLPLFLKSRFSLFLNFNWISYFKSNFITVIISLLIGAASHIFWDSFTHIHGYFVQVIPFLKSSILILDKPIPIFKLLQHFSTVSGGLIIALVVYKLPVNEAVVTKISLRYWNIVTISALIIFSIRFLINPEAWHIGDVIVTGISASLIGVILASLFTRVKS